MRKVVGDPAALVAATLVQAEMALRGGLLAGRKPGTFVRGQSRTAVADSYEYFLQLVETGQRPAPSETGDEDE